MAKMQTQPNTAMPQAHPANFNPYQPQAPGGFRPGVAAPYGAPPYGARPAYGAPQPYGGRPAYGPQQPPAQQAAPVMPVASGKKQKAAKKRKESDHFFIQRKGVTFLIMLLCLALIALVGLNVLGMMPEFTSVVVAPDYTPADARKDDYEDKSQYITSGELLFGVLNSVFKMDLYGGMKEAIDEEIALNKTLTKEEIAERYDSIAMFSHAQYDEVMARFEENGQSGLGVMMFQYAGLFIVLIIVICLITVVKCLASFSGRRLWKRFGLTAIILMVLGVGLLLAGLGALMSTDAEATALDFGNIADFAMGALGGVPETLDAEAVYLQYVAGFGALGFVAVPVLVLLMSLFAKRKIYYSIFDR